jgi:hypothetical protein
VIRYYIRFQRFATPGHVETDDSSWSTWHGAKYRRNQLFKESAEVFRIWVERIDERTDNGLIVELSKHRWGNVLRKQGPPSETA